MEILQENDEYRLEFERLQNKWWLTLVEKSSGMAQVLVSSNNKKESRDTFGDLDLLEIRNALERWHVPKIKTYKAI